MVPWLAWLVLRARVTSGSGPSLRKCYLTFHIPLTSSSAIFQHCPGGTDVETYSQQLPCLAWDFLLGMCSRFLSWYVPLPQHSIGPAPLPPAPSSCRSGAEQYSHRWEGAKSCGSFVRVQRDVGFHGDLLESHSAAANFSTSFVLPFSGYPAFVHLHLRRFFFWHKVTTANPGRPQHLLSEAVTAIAGRS